MAIRVDRIQLQFIIDQQRKGDALEKINDELRTQQKLVDNLEKKKKQAEKKITQEKWDPHSRRATGATKRTSSALRRSRRQTPSALLRQDVKEYRWDGHLLRKSFYTCDRRCKV